jgi:Asp-tRNA(Asn)/Glu-tRNA(Gln) amidotransferase A subunit family amidase
LPIGLQFIGRDEETVLRLGSAYERIELGPYRLALDRLTGRRSSM